MQIDLSTILLVIIAIELALIYVRLGTKEEEKD